MEKPKLPAKRKLDEFVVTPYQNYLIVFDGWDKTSVSDVQEAEMLIHALAEWIEYKRQLEKWEREHTL